MVGNWIHMRNTDFLLQLPTPEKTALNIIVVLYYPIKIEAINRFNE